MKIIFTILFGILYIFISLSFGKASNILSVFLGTFIASLLFYYCFNFLSKKIQKDSCKYEFDPKSHLLGKYLMNLKQGLLIDGGTGYLLSDKFIFIPNKFSLVTKVEILYSNIDKIVNYKKIGIKICKVFLVSGETKLFIINDNDFYNDIMKILDKKKC